MHECVYLYHMYKSARRGWKRVLISLNWRHRWLQAAWHGCWELNLGLQQDWQVLLAREHLSSPGWAGLKTGMVTETRVGKSSKAECHGGERYAESKAVDGVDLGNRLLPAQQKSRRNDGLPEIQNQDWRTWEVKGLRQQKINKQNSWV